MNNLHIRYLLGSDFDDQKSHFEGVFNTKVDVDINSKESLANFINLCVKHGWEHHTFYTIVLLYFLSF